jgi:hypothetical protein
VLTKGDLPYVFFGSALAVNASLSQPMTDFLTEQTAAVLPPSGGYAVQTRKQTNFREIVRSGRASATIAGNANAADHFSTIAMATIEKLDILGFIKADAIVSRIAARAPNEVADDGGVHPTTFFLHGSAFHGLQINGKHYEPTIGIGGADTPTDLDQRLLYEVTSDHGYKLRADAVGSMQIFKGIESVLEFPEFGKIFVGEVDCFKGRMTLSMIRVELGGTMQGSVTGPVACVNGHPPKPIPPP